MAVGGSSASRVAWAMRGAAGGEVGRGSWRKTARDLLGAGGSGLETAGPVGFLSAGGAGGPGLVFGGPGGFVCAGGAGVVLGWAGRPLCVPGCPVRGVAVLVTGPGGSLPGLRGALVQGGPVRGVPVLCARAYRGPRCPLPGRRAGACARSLTRRAVPGWGARVGGGSVLRLSPGQDRPAAAGHPLCPLPVMRGPAAAGAPHQRDALPPTGGAVERAGHPAGAHRTQPAGRQESGVRSPDQRASGVRSPGRRASGVQVLSVGASGVRSSGRRASGRRVSGVGASGVRSPGLRASGVRASGRRASGRWSPGLRVSGRWSSGVRSSGLRALGVRSSGRWSSGWMPVGRWVVGLVSGSCVGRAEAKRAFYLLCFFL